MFPTTPTSCFVPRRTEQVNLELVDAPEVPSASEPQPLLGATAPAAPLPSPPPGAPPADATASDSRKLRTRVLIAVGLVVLAIAAITIIVASSEGEGGGLPTEVAGFSQVDTEETRALEETMGQMKFGDLEVTFGFYGQARVVELILVRYENMPPGTPAEGVLRGAGGGIIGSGGSADIDATTVTMVDGISYHCLPFQGRLFPNDPVESAGRVCAWLEGADVMVLMDSATDDVRLAAEHAASAHAALGG